MVELLSIQAIHGLVYGMLLFLVASGLTLVLGMMGVLNLAHTSFYMVGAYIAYTITVFLGNFWLSLLIAPVVVGLLGVLIERFVLRKSYKGGHEAQFLLTFGLFFIFNELVRIIWGSSSLSVPPPVFLAGSVSLVGIVYPAYRLFIVFISLVVLIGMALLILRTRIGIIIRAAVSDADMVSVLGINVRFVTMGVLGGGAALAAFAGVIAVPFLGTYPGLAGEAMLDCLVIVVVGGFGSLIGAFIASLMIGEFHSFGILYIPKAAMIFPVLLMVIVLMLRPMGLFGEKE